MANATNLTNTTTALAVTSDSDDPAVIQRQIDYTRAQLATTINAIGERLSPENLLAQAKYSAKEATVGRFRDMTNEANRKMEGMSGSLSQTVRENPLPVAVIGLGLGWLLMANRNKHDGYRAGDYDYRSSGYRYYEDMEARGRLEQARERAGDIAHDVAHSVESRAADVRRQVDGVGESVGDYAQRAGETVSQTAQRAGETVSQTAHRVGETLGDTAARVGETFSDTAGRVGDTAEMAQERAGEALMRTRSEADRLRREAMWRSQVAVDRTKESFWNTMEQNPLVLGAVLAIAGAAIGASIPATEYENRLLGETRDRFVDEAKLRAQDAVERVQTVVDDTRSAAMSEIKDAAERENILGTNG